MSEHTINTVNSIFRLTFLFILTLIVIYVYNIAQTYGYSVQSANQLIGLVNRLIVMFSSLIGL